MKLPVLSDFYNARNIVYRYLKPTPLFFNKQFSDEIGAKIYIKFENHQPINVFKVRGGLVKISHLTEKEKATGVITPSTGNHGQSIAFAARTFGVKSIIYAPENNNPDKTKSMQNLGAEVVLIGKDFDEAREACEERAVKDGLVLVHPANEPYLLHGVGTLGLEIFEDLPEIDLLISPVGGGSSCCSNAIVLKSLNPKIKVIAVQAENAPAVYNSYHAGKMLAHPSANTFADGLATRVPFEFPFKIMQNVIDDVVLVSENELEQAIVRLFDSTHNIAEGAGAASTAAAFRYADMLRGKTVVLLLSGGNITREKFCEILNKWEKN